ncbi:hypothetical protein QFW77_02465 [Luteimonas sp. RD2P54]|uniref:Uncharacterized protein n=1 Tax=Luteimonas endophytica TaxID=3042023 RepID=A0ABT6J4X5_9GAMM|nr:hypothetical protein [Luteimonas endophytica]MDH5821859.1 hypothetical protein [Luteimonas endophytica]
MSDWFSRARRVVRIHRENRPELHEAYPSHTLVLSYTFASDVDSAPLESLAKPSGFSIGPKS